MADEKTSGQKAVEAGQLDIAVIGSGATSGDFETGREAVVKTAGSEAFEANAKDLKEEPEAGDDEGDEASDAADKGDDPEAEEGEGDAEAEAEAEAPVGELGEYNADDEAVAEKFDAHYLHEVDGAPQINFDKFNEELTANIAAGITDINKGGRQYLKSKFGVSDEFITDHIAGLVLLRKSTDDQFYSRVGGKETYEKQIAWGTENYDAAQKEAFNKAIKNARKDPTALADQLDLLNLRYSRANPTKDEGAGKKEEVTEKTKTIGLRRGATAKKNATENGGASAPPAQPFASAKEHQKAQAEALRSKDPAKIEAVRARLKASSKQPWFSEQ